MIKTKGTIRFNLRIDKLLKDGSAPIELIYSISQKRKYLNTGLKINPVYWNVSDKRVQYLNNREIKKLLPDRSSFEYLSESEVIDINNDLESLINRINEIERYFLANKELFTATMVMDRLKESIGKQTKKEEPTGLVFDFMDQYIRDHESVREPGSLTVYKSVKNHLKAYQDASGHKVSFETVDYQFFQKFQTFLVNRKKYDKAGNPSPMLNNTTIAKALSTLKTFLNYARKMGIQVNNGYKNFAINRERLKVIALEQPELVSLLQLDLSNNKKLERVRDVFCFACATGLRYSDVAQLRNEHIKDGIITIVVKKTKTELTIPLNSISSGILEKYQGQIRPLPVISNQKLNEYIKELCKLAEINTPFEIIRFYGNKRIVNVYPKYELVHFHTARKTFITLSLEKGMSAEEVMGISGHSDYKSFKRYVDVTEKRKKEVMVKAWGVPEERKLKVV